jgi:hypothetical protein
MGSERAGAGNGSALEGLEPCSITPATAGGDPDPRASALEAAREPSADAASSGGGASGADGALAAGCGREGRGPVAAGRGAAAGAALGERGGAALGERGNAALGAGGRESRNGAGLGPAANGLDATRGSFVGDVGRWLCSLAFGDDAAARAAALASAFV